MLFFIFSTIADRAFGGLVNNKSFEVFRDSSIPDSYVDINFNDYFTSFVTLFSLMVVNNWWVIAQLYTNVTGNTYARWFFILFYFM